MLFRHINSDKLLLVMLHFNYLKWAKLVVYEMLDEVYRMKQCTLVSLTLTKVCYIGKVWLFCETIVATWGKNSSDTLFHFLINVKCEDLLWNCVTDTSYRKSANFWLVSEHFAGRALTSDWFINSFILVAYENYFIRVLDRKFWLKWLQ